MPAASGSSSPGTDADDVDFDPTAEDLINDYDDERTMDEEEAMSNEESVTDELNDLQKEGDMPLEELLAIYGCGREQSSVVPVSSAAVSSHAVGDVSSSSSGAGDDTGIGNGRADDSVGVEPEPLQTSRLLRSDDIGGSSSDEEDDEDYDPDNDEYWKKNVQVGPDHQANVPDGLLPYETPQVYESEDRLLWDPSKLSDAVVEQYNAEIQRYNRANCEGVYTIPTGAHIKDDEQALYLLLQCNHDVSEALRRHRLQSIPPTDPMSLWSEEECRNFENGLRTYGKDFFQIQVNRVRTRSVGELIQFYYLWKKTERHDAFAARTRLEKKRYTMHPGITDYMDRFLDEMDNPFMESQGSAVSSCEVRYGAASCDGGSPVPAAIPPSSSSLENSAAVSTSHRNSAASAKDGADDNKSQQSIACASSKSFDSKNCRDSAGSSSACCPDDGRLHRDELLQMGCHTASASAASDEENMTDGSGALVICEDSVLESAESRLDSYMPADSVHNAEESAHTVQNRYADAIAFNSSRKDEASAAAAPVETSGQCLESDSVAVSNICAATADGVSSLPANAEAVSSGLSTADVSYITGTSDVSSLSHPGVLGSRLATIAGSLDAVNGNLPLAGIFSSVTNVISSSADRTLAASSAASSESVVLTFAANVTAADTSTSDVLSSVQPMEVSTCSTLSADLTDIPVETLVPPVDLMDVDPMDVSVDTLVPLVDHTDKVGNIGAEVASERIGKMDVKSSSADSTFDTFGLTPFSSLGLPDALADSSLSAKPEHVEILTDSAAASGPDPAVATRSFGGEEDLLSAAGPGSEVTVGVGLVQDNRSAVFQESNNSPGSSEDVLPLTSSSGSEFVGSVNSVMSCGAAGCASANGSTATEPSDLPVTFLKNEMEGCQTNVAGHVQPALVLEDQKMPTSDVQGSESDAESERNKPCVESANNEDAAIQPAEIDSASHTSSSEALDAVSSSAVEVDNPNGNSNDLVNMPVTTDGCKTVAVGCSDVRSADDSRKVPSSPFAPVLSDCHVGPSMMSS